MPPARPSQTFASSYTIRLAVGSPQTGAADVDEAWRQVSAAASAVLETPRT